jgi:hypothetical protein
MLGVIPEFGVRPRPDVERSRPVLRLVWRFLVTLLITLFVAEIVCRVYNSLQPSYVFYDNSYRRYRGRPHSPDYDFHLNSRGFKDLEFNPTKERGSFRIVALGDSFAFGVVPYQYNYLTLLDESLNHGGRKAEVLNMGIPGIGPKEYLDVLLSEGLQLEPDMVLVSFFIGNDFSESRAERKLYTYSYLATFVNFLLVTRRLEGQIVHGGPHYDDDASTFPEETFIGIERARSQIYRKQNHEFDSDLAAAVRYLDEIKQVCDEHHVALAVVLIPDNIQIDRVLQARVLQSKPMDAGTDDVDFALPNRRLAAKLTELNIECLDLLDEFEARAARTVLYKPNDTHWNIAGNKVAAELIGSRLFPSQSKPQAR